jgi:hypothetical protein
MARYAQNKMLLYIFKIYLCISLALAWNPKRLSLT